MSGSAVDGRSPRCPTWAWALLLVACVHVLTAPGTWTVSDHAEELFMARRLLTHGTFTLAPAGEPLPELPWWTPRPLEPSRSRLFPGTAVALAPLLLVDRMLGWDAPGQFGRIAHFGGSLYVLAALALLGSATTRAGASPQASSLMVVLLGTSWPLWQISRHGGAEPVLSFLLALLLYGRLANSLRTQTAACLLLPWVHPTGCLIAPGVSVFGLIETYSPGRERPRTLAVVAESRRVAAVAAASVASVLLVWNYGYHGHWWGGGYATQGATAWGLFARPPLQALAFYSSECALLEPVLLALAAAGANAAGRAGLRWLALAVWLLVLHLALFAVFSSSLGQEPARRLSVVWLAWGLVVGLTWDRLQLPGRAAHGLIALNLLLGFYWFELREWNYYPARDGAYYPLVLWVTLALRDGPTAALVIPLLAVCALGLLAGARLWRLLEAARLQGPEGPTARTRSPA